MSSNQIQEKVIVLDVFFERTLSLRDRTNASLSECISSSILNHGSDVNYYLKASDECNIKLSASSRTWHTI
jgi:hypothetical protein